MSDYVEKYEFEKEPKEIEYKEGEPLKLTKEFRFYHNKVKFRKDLKSLQNLFEKYTKHPLIAAGIRGSYLKDEYFEKYLVILFTTVDKIKKGTELVDRTLNGKDIEKDCFIMESTSDCLTVVAKDMDGIKFGIQNLELLLEQTLEDYLQQKEFDKFIQIRPFRLYNCPK